MATGCGSKIGPFDCCTIVVGDCLDVMVEIPDRYIGLVITDPPYNVTDCEWDQIGNRKEYLTWTQRWLAEAMRILRKDFHLFTFCSPDYFADFEMLIRTEGWPLKSRLIWHHKNFSGGSRPIKNKFASSWEPVFHMGSYALNWPERWGKERFDVQEHAAPQTNFKDKKVHQMQKPLSLVEVLVRLGSRRGGTIFDPFMGGGTTAVAAAKANRHFFGCDSSPEYVAIAEKRLSIIQLAMEI